MPAGALPLAESDIPPTTPAGLRQSAWTAYWRTGSLHSLAGSLSDDLDGPVRAFWEETFALLMAQDRVIDIGTGNGPLPALLCRLRGDAMPSVDAVDLAEVAPVWLASSPPACRRSVHFHGRTSAESLPFPDHHYSLAVSQFGLEYTQLERSVAELGRVVRTDGRVALLVHHASSQLTRVAGEEVRLVDLLLSPDGLLAVAWDIYPYLALVAQGRSAQLSADPQATRARHRFNDAMRDLQVQIAQSPYPDVLLDTRAFLVDWTRALAAGAASLEQARQAHRDYQQALQDAAFRSRELCAHALDEDGLAQLRERFVANGFRVIECNLLHHGPMLIGWTLRAQRAGD